MTSRQLLFREQALDFQREAGRWGDVVPLQPPPTSLLTGFLAAVVILIGGFLLTAQYARKETVAGYLAPAAGSARVFANQRGTIAAVYVRQGQLVTEGQPLLAVETDQIAANGADVNVSLLATLGSQRALLSQNLQAERARTGSERRRLTELIDGLESELSQLQAQAAVQEQRIEVAHREVAAADELAAKGYMPMLEQNRRLSNYLEAEQDLNAVKAQIAARRNQLVETRFELAQLPTVMAQKAQSLQTELAAAEQRIAEVNGRRAYVIRAPITGRVAMLQARVGESIEPQRLQMEILPAGASLQAELFVPTRAIGFVRPGQDVRILYDAFPYEHFGAYRGRVAEVSQTILTNADAAGPMTLKEPAYRVTAHLERQDVDAYGKRARLQPDMLLRADVIIEKRPLLTWFLDPVLRARR
jgi:membrane fusion protein